MCFVMQMCVVINDDNIHYVYKSKEYAVNEMYAIITKKIKINIFNNNESNV